MRAFPFPFPCVNFHSMVKRKFRKRRRNPRGGRWNPILPVTPNRKIKTTPLKPVKQEIVLTDSDRLSVLYEVDENGKVQNVVNVSYDVKVGKGWVTIVHYDSKHGYLHRHMRISLAEPREEVTTSGVIQRGGPKKWLVWAIKDFTKDEKYINYRVGFFRRSKIKDLY